MIYFRVPNSAQNSETLTLYTYIYKKSLMKKLLMQDILELAFYQNVRLSMLHFYHWHPVNLLANVNKFLLNIANVVFISIHDCLHFDWSQSRADWFPNHIVTWSGSSCHGLLQYFSHIFRQLVLFFFSISMLIIHASAKFILRVNRFVVLLYNFFPQVESTILFYLIGLPRIEIFYGY